MINWFSSKKWHIRNNKTRKSSDKNRGKHPALIVGATKEKYANIGITTNKYRGHHKNIKIEDIAKNQKEPSYLRDDLQLHNKSNFSEPLVGYKFSRKDKSKADRIIAKYKNKKKITAGR